MEGEEKPRLSRKQLFIAMLIFSALTASIFWRYFQGTYLAGSDAMGPFADVEMMKVESSYFSSWRDITALGYLNFPSPVLSVFFYLTTGVMNADVVLLWKVMLIAAFWLTGILMFHCAYQITGSYLGSLMAGLVYALNQVFLSQVTEVHHYFILGYALFPLLFLMIYRTMEGQIHRGLILLPLLAITYGTISSPHTVLITGIFLLLFILTYAIFLGRSSRRDHRYGLLLGAVCVLIMVLPMVLMKYSGGGSSTLDIHYSIEEAGAYSSYSIYHSLILASTENTFIQGATGGVWTYPPELMVLGLAIALIVPTIAFLSIWIHSRRALILSLLLPSLLFIFLAKGPNPPLGEVFTFLFSNVPIMDSIRVYSRLHLLTGFAYALLIALVLANLDDLRSNIPDLKGWVQRAARILLRRKVLVLLIVVAMLLPSSALFLSDEPRSFDLPSEYAEPYLWLRDQDGNFRVLNLPYQQVYYTAEGEIVDGYPSTMTLDVGMYSTLISNKPYAYGVETQDYWSFLGSTLEERRFGYQQLAQVLGGMASVRYVVSQVQTSAVEEDLFASLEGLTLKQSFPGGSDIYENSQWAAQIHAVDRMCLLVGTRADIPTALGLGVLNLTTDGILLIDQVSSLKELDNYLDQVDLVVLGDASLLGLAAGLSWPEAYTVDLAELANSHSTQTERAWVRSSVNYSSGVSSKLTADTSGANSLEVSMTAEEAGSYDLLLSLVKGPEAGQLKLTIDDKNVTELFPYAPYLNEEWVRIGGLNLTKGQHTVTISSDGSGNCSLGQLTLVPHQEVDDRLSALNQMLGNHTASVIYMAGASSGLWSNGTYFPWTGPKGQGISSTWVLAASDLGGYAQIVDDNAYLGRAIALEERQRLDSPTIRYLQGGTNYSVTLSVNNPGEASTSSQIEVWAGVNGSLSLIQVDSAVIPSSGGYKEQAVSFSLPKGMDSAQVRIYAGGNGLRIDRLSMSAEDNVSPELGMEVDQTGEYVLHVAGGEGRINMDGEEIAYSVHEDGVYSYMVGNLTAGHHLLGVGSKGVYAIYLSPVVSQVETPSSSVEFQRISNVEFSLKVSSEGPTWVMLSESYHSLWSAEMDGTVLEHVQADSMINAFYVPEGGVHTITVRFLGQDTYESILLSMLILLVASTALFSLVLLARTRSWRLQWRRGGKG